MHANRLFLEHDAHSCVPAVLCTSECFPQPLLLRFAGTGEQKSSVLRVGLWEEFLVLSVCNVRKDPVFLW